MRGGQAIDLRLTAQQSERRPIERDVVEREPGAILVTDFGMSQAQRTRKRAAEALNLHRAAAELRREPLDRRTAGAGIRESDDEQNPEQRQGDDRADDGCRYSHAAFCQKAIRQKDWPSPI